jgi:DNA-binding protein
MTYEKNNVAVTSLKQVAALLKKAPLKPGTVNLDLGGGKYDLGTDYLATKNIINYVLDPFNRSEEHNREVVEILNARGGADSVTLANVLNVIESERHRHNTLMKASMHMHIGAHIYIETVVVSER